MRYLVISTSLNPKSHSCAMAQVVRDRLVSLGETVAWLDLREHVLPLCDGGACYEDLESKYCTKLVAEADGVILASAVYNYDVTAGAKNLLEISGSAWEEKVVGLLCSAGGHASYMSVMGVANSLMLDFRSFILPRFVYATEDDFTEARQIHNEEILERLRGLADELVRVTGALRGSGD